LSDSPWKSVEQKSVLAFRFVEILFHHPEDEFIADQLSCVHHLPDLLAEVRPLPDLGSQQVPRCQVTNAVVRFQLWSLKIK
jgi:hypothetical protein